MIYLLFLCMFSCVMGINGEKFKGKGKHNASGRIFSGEDGKRNANRSNEIEEEGEAPRAKRSKEEDLSQKKKITQKTKSRAGSRRSKPPIKPSELKAKAEEAQKNDRTRKALEAEKKKHQKEEERRRSLEYRRGSGASSNMYDAFAYRTRLKSNSSVDEDNFKEKIYEAAIQPNIERLKKECPKHKGIKIQWNDSIKNEEAIKILLLNDNIENLDKELFLFLIKMDYLVVLKTFCRLSENTFDVSEDDISFTTSDRVLKILKDDASIFIEANKTFQDIEDDDKDVDVAQPIINNVQKVGSANVDYDNLDKGDEKRMVDEGIEEIVKNNFGNTDRVRGVKISGKNNDDKEYVFYKRVSFGSNYNLRIYYIRQGNEIRIIFIDNKDGDKPDINTIEYRAKVAYKEWFPERFSNLLNFN